MSVFENTFKYQVIVDAQYHAEIESYCQNEIGEKTYFINGYFGGRHWRISTQWHGLLYSTNSSRLIVDINDEHHALILALKYS